LIADRPIGSDLIAHDGSCSGCGESLRDRMTRDGRLPVDATIRIATEVLTARLIRGEIYRLSPAPGTAPKRARCIAMVSRQTLLVARAD
jgi:hypothetical protein